MYYPVCTMTSNTCYTKMIGGRGSPDESIQQIWTNAFHRICKIFNLILNIQKYKGLDIDSL